MHDEVVTKLQLALLPFYWQQLLKLAAGMFVGHAAYPCQLSETVKCLHLLLGLQYYIKCKQRLPTILRGRLVAQAVLVWGEKHWKLFKTFLVDQLKLLMEGLMDPTKVQKYLADQEMFRMWVARQRKNKASR